MEKYNKIFKEDNSTHFINSLHNTIKTKFKFYSYEIYKADYNPKEDKVTSKYEKIESKKHDDESSDLDDMITKFLSKLHLNIFYQYSGYSIENGFVVIKLYEYKDEPILVKYGDKNFIYAMKNDKPLIQELIVCTIAEVNKLNNK